MLPRSAPVLALLLLLPFGAGLAAPAALLPQDLWSTRVPADAGAEDLGVVEPLPVPRPELGLDAAAPVFAPDVRVSSTQRIGEPALKIDGNGVVYVHAPGRFWKSTNNGSSFTQVALTGVVTCGCDSDVSIDAANNVMYTDLAYPNCVNVGMTPDQGAHWVANRYACGLDQGIGMDRQWIETDGKFSTYLTYRVGGTILLAYAPLSPLPAFLNIGPVNQFGSNFRAGYLAVDKAQDRAYLSYTSGNSVRVAIVEGPLVLDDRLVASTGGSNLDAFSAPAVDEAGNVYVVWNERGVVGGATITKSMLSASTDGGLTWSAPLRVDTTATTVFPWIVAGAAGKVGIVYYGSSDAKLPGSVTGDWFVHYAYSDNAASASPTFTDVVAVAHSVRTGPICTQGTGCPSGTRGFLDFFGVHLFPDGRAGIAFNDQTGLASNVAPYVNFAQQVDGPRLR